VADYALLGCGSWINLLFFLCYSRCRAGMANERQADFFNKRGFRVSYVWPGFRFYRVLEATVKINSRYSIARGCPCV